nr:NADH dehydrogenase subunit 6 [Runcina aurata]
MGLGLIFFLLLNFLNNPLSLGSVLILLSFLSVGLLTLFSNWWYCYILFLVYVGGLLVLFMYICLMSSNYPFFMSKSFWGYLFLLSFFFMNFSSMFDIQNYNLISTKYIDMGVKLLSESNMSLYLMMVLLLLMVLLIIVRVSGASSLSVK